MHQDSRRRPEALEIPRETLPAGSAWTPRGHLAYFAVSAAKRMFVGTRWEEPLKRLYYAATRGKNVLYDWQTIAIMRRVLRRDSCAVDIGAFEGGMLRHMLRFAPRGQHWAFEPLPDRCEDLRRRFPTAHVCPVALGSSSGSATFTRVLRAPALSGLRRRMDLAAAEPTEEITVRVETLDRVLPEDLPVGFVKIDVEGGEEGVFRGGVRTLRRTRPVVVFECGLGGADSYGSTPARLYELITADIGLRVSRLGDWLDRSPDLTSEEFIRAFELSQDYYFVAHP